MPVASSQLWQLKRTSDIVKCPRQRVKSEEGKSPVVENHWPRQRESVERRGPRRTLGTPALPSALGSVHGELKGSILWFNFSRTVGPRELKGRGEVISCENCRGPVSSTWKHPTNVGNSNSKRSSPTVTSYIIKFSSPHLIPSSWQMVAFTKDHCPQRETPYNYLERLGLIQIRGNHGYRFSIKLLWPRM